MFKLFMMYWGVINLVTFIVYFIDKKKAMNGSSRISEKTLHLLAFLGGTIGAFVAQRVVRHKNKKFSFLVIFYLTVVVQLVLLYFAVMNLEFFQTTS